MRPWLSIPLPAGTPLDLLRFAAPGERRFYFRTRDGRRQWAGLGVAGQVLLADPEEMGPLRPRADALLASLCPPIPAGGPGPVLIGGFAFDQASTLAGPFVGWPGAELLLPRWLAVWDGPEAALVTVGDEGAEGDAVEASLAELLARWTGAGEDRPPTGCGPDIADDGPSEAGDRLEHRVVAVLDQIRRGTVRKVTVARARRTDVPSPGPVRFLEACGRLHPTATHFWFDGPGGSALAGVSPERLVSVDAATLRTEALAGTAPRGAEGEDDAVARELARNPKEQAEHDEVVRFIRALVPTAELQSQAEAVALPYAWHLRTRLHAPRAGAHVLDLAMAFQPTPAVGGQPREPALREIQRLEAIPRGWFAGAFGVAESHGQGEFCVAIRSGLLFAESSWLWAGAGVVEGSDPAVERAEIDLKLAAMGSTLQAARQPASLPPPGNAHRNSWAAAVLVDAWIAHGLLDACISPGSRSTPLALALAARSEISLHVHIDERASAFFALGLARATGRPVLVLCTSGSAAGQLLPAALEADLASIPLILVTADRPRELHDCGAPQTVSQRGIFGGAVRHAEEISDPSVTALWESWLRGRVARAWERGTTAPAGPVHWNFAFAEPLAPSFVEGEVPLERLGRPTFRPSSPAPIRRRSELDLRGRGLIIVGPGPLLVRDRASIVGLAERAGAPMLADPLSGLRSLTHCLVIDTADAWCRAPDVLSSLEPDWVLRVGRTPTSKALSGAASIWTKARQFILDPDGRREDPEQQGGLWVRTGPAETRFHLHGSVDPKWPARIRRVHDAVDRVRTLALDQAPPSFEGRVIRALAQAIDPTGQVLVASSMPVRDLDSFLRAGDTQASLIANRGVNGIDGLVSTTLGLAASGRPTWALLGDLAFLHDIGGLAAVKRCGTRATLVVVNNDGGAIFEALPVARTADPRVFEALFVTPHGLRFEDAAQQFGLEYLAPVDEASLVQALKRDDDTPARLVELTVDRRDSLLRHQAYHQDAVHVARAALDLVEREERS